MVRFATHDATPRSLQEGLVNRRSGLDAEPVAAWPWRRPVNRPLLAPVRASADPETETVERTHGLTGEVARRWAAHVPSILGPLRFERYFRPLSLEGGRLRAVSLVRVPPVPDWQQWLTDVEHVQTNDPEVCLALADGRRSFVVGSTACADVVRRVTRAELVQQVPDGAKEMVLPWIAPPDLDEGFVPLVRLAHEVWLCWDGDEERPAVVLEGAGRPHWVGRGGDRLSSDLGPVGPLPYAASAPPLAPASHLAAAGAHWAAAATRVRKLEPPQLVTAPGNRWAIVSPEYMGAAPGGDEFAWWWRHRPGCSVAELPKGYRWSGSVVSIEILEQKAARIRWSGEHRVFRLRNGELDVITEPHTLDRQMAKQGKVLDEQQAQMFRNIISGGFGLEEEIVELPLEAGDRLLVCTDKTLRVFTLETLKRILSGDIRRCANELQLGLEAAEIADAALILTPQATSDVTHPGWLTQLALSLVEEEPTPPRDFGDGPPKTDPYDMPQRWTIHRRDYPILKAPVDPPSPRWIDACRAALADLAFRPMTGDIVRMVPDERCVVQLQFNGEAWCPIDASGPPSAKERVAAGRIAFREDAPSAPLAAILTRAASEPTSAVEVEKTALEEGFVELALWLNLVGAHRRGESATGLEIARDQVSQRVRVALGNMDVGPDVRPHEVEARSLVDHRERYHGCVVRYRSLVSEGLEAMFTAGAWWDPDGPDVLRPHSRYYAEVLARWEADPQRGYGHFHLSRALASGTAVPLPIPDDARRITEDDLRRRTVRRGVPLRVELVVSVNGYEWKWERYEIQRPSGEPSAAPCTFRADMIVAIVERMVVLKVLSRTPVTGQP